MFGNNIESPTNHSFFFYLHAQRMFSVSNLNNKKQLSLGILIYIFLEPLINKEIIYIHV
jgi:hypothetical protein